MGHRFAVIVFAVFALTLAASAKTVRSADPVLDVIRIDELLEIMYEESLQSGASLEADMLDGRGGLAWRRILEQINDTDRWEVAIRQRMSSELPATHVDAIVSFFQSAQGQRILELELSARRAFLSDEIEEASEAHLMSLREDDDPIIAQLDRFVEINNLIDSNVKGALESNMAFFDGLRAGVGRDLPGTGTESVMAREPEIRDSTTTWVYSFLAMAYTPLDPAELEVYIAFSESEAGQAFNAALFSAFDMMFVTTSRETGQAIGRILSSEDI